jgi:predicted transcriptional regulator
MTTLELNDETTALLVEMAEREHTTPAQLANRLLIECLEDWQDAQAADRALAELERGEDKLLDWRDVKTGLYDDMAH